MNNVSRKLIILIGFFGSMGQVYAGTIVYVPVGGANEILIIDGNQDKVVGRIGDVTNAHGLAATPDGNYLVATQCWVSYCSPSASVSLLIKCFS